MMSKQNEVNAESNKNLPELQKMLNEQIKIHDKPVPFVEGAERKFPDGERKFPEGERKFPDGERKFHHHDGDKESIAK